MQNVYSASLAKLLNFIESSENELSPEYGCMRVCCVKSVNPGSEKGWYAVDLEILDDYNNDAFDSRRRTDSMYLVRAYQILIGN